MLVAVIVLMKNNGVDTLKSRSQIIVLVNNASRNGRVLKFILVIWAIKKY
jgi:hypothetical protein